MVGTLLGMPDGYSLSDVDSVPSGAGGYIGMAPDAKVAFIGARGGCGGVQAVAVGQAAVACRSTGHSIPGAACSQPCNRIAPAHPLTPSPPTTNNTDLGDSTGDIIFTPSDLANSYFPYTYDVGAYVHSGGWLAEWVLRKRGVALVVSGG